MGCLPVTRCWVRCWCRWDGWDSPTVHHRSTPSGSCRFATPLGSPAMRLLFFGTYDAAAHPRVAVLRDGLRERGATVRRVQRPAGALHRRPGRHAAQPARPAAPGLADRAGAGSACGAGPGASAARAAGRTPWSWATSVTSTSCWPDGSSRTCRSCSTTCRRERHRPDRGVAGGPRQRLLRALDGAALAAADVVVVDTEEHRSALPAAARRRAVVVAVGAPQEWYAAQPAGRDAPPAGGGRRELRVVFFGLFTPLQGAPVIGAALRAGGRRAGRAPRWSAPGRTWPRPGGRRRATTGCAGWTGCRPPSCPRWWPATTSASASSARARRRPGGAQQGVPGRGGRLRGRHLRHPAAAPGARGAADAAVLVPAGDPGALAAALRDLAADRTRLELARAAARKLALDAFTPARVVAPLARPAALAASPRRPDVVPTGPTAPRQQETVTLPPLSPNGWLRWAVVSRLLPAPDPGAAGPRGRLRAGRVRRTAGPRLRLPRAWSRTPTSCTVAKRRLAVAGGRGEVRHGDLAALREDEAFDLVCAFEVIEHIEDDHAAMAEWAGRLRPGGTRAALDPGLAAALRRGRRDGRPLPPLRPAGACARCSPAPGLVDVELVHFGAPLGYLLEAGRNAAGRRRLAAGADRGDQGRALGRQRPDPAADDVVRGQRRAAGHAALPGRAAALPAAPAPAWSPAPASPSLTPELAVAVRCSAVLGSGSPRRRGRAGRR